MPPITPTQSGPASIWYENVTGESATAKKNTGRHAGRELSSMQSRPPSKQTLEKLTPHPAIAGETATYVQFQKDHTDVRQSAEAAHAIRNNASVRNMLKVGEAFDEIYKPAFKMAYSEAVGQGYKESDALEFSCNTAKQFATGIFEELNLPGHSDYADFITQYKPVIWEISSPYSRDTHISIRYVNRSSPAAHSVVAGETAAYVQFHKDHTDVRQSVEAMHAIKNNASVRNMLKVGEAFDEIYKPAFETAYNEAVRNDYAESEALEFACKTAKQFATEIFEESDLPGHSEYADLIAQYKPVIWEISSQYSRDTHIRVRYEFQSPPMPTKQETVQEPVALEPSVAPAVENLAENPGSQSGQVAPEAAGETNTQARQSAEAGEALVIPPKKPPRTFEHDAQQADLKQAKDSLGIMDFAKKQAVTIQSTARRVARAVRTKVNGQKAKVGNAFLQPKLIPNPLYEQAGPKHVWNLLLKSEHATAISVSAREPEQEPKQEPKPGRKILRSKKLGKVVNLFHTSKK